MIDAIPQLSLEPLSMSDGTTVKLPFSSKSNDTVPVNQAAVGAVSSTILTVAVQEDVAPCASVTVSVTI